LGEAHHAQLDNTTTDNDDGDVTRNAGAGTGHVEKELRTDNTTHWKA
jgi:hypothetical protein